MASLLLLFFFSTFSLVAAGVVGYHIFLERRALEGRNGLREGGDVEWIEPSDLLKTDALSTISFWDQLLARVNYVSIMKARIAEAGLRWSVGRLTALMLLMAALASACLHHWFNLDWYLNLAAAAGTGWLPYGFVLRLRRKRLTAFESQFSDALDSLARALRAGHPLAVGMQMVAEEASEPVRSEIRTTLDERNLGLNWDQALDHFAERVPLVEVSTFAAAVKLQSRTGGRLNEVLGRLAETIRESSALKGEVRAIATHGRMTGGVLTVLPIVIALILAVVNPNYIALLYGSETGRTMVSAAVICLVLAHFVIRKMVDIRL